MSEYITKSYGPGSIGALVSGAALAHPPTIGSNDPIRDIHGATYGPRKIPSLSGCGCGMGTEPANGNGDMKPFLGALLLPLAAFGVLFVISKMP
jgi:hypothetical protein